MNHDGWDQARQMNGFFDEQTKILIKENENKKAEDALRTTIE